MRRFASILLFVLGGWVLMTQMLVAFLDMDPGVGEQISMIIMMASFAGLFLLLGAWASPGQRWRELGLTMLMAAGIALFCALSLAAVMLDPAMTRYIPNLPSLRLAPVVGGINLLACAVVGWLLYRRGDKPDPAEIFR